jgi:sodium/proline symporter
MQYLAVGFACYFLVACSIVLFLSLWGKRLRSQSYATMLLGNRSVNYILTAFSAHASDMSDWLFMAFPAALYGNGLASAWIAVGLIAGMWASWRFVAPRLRILTENLGAMTLCSYFEKRFNDTTGSIGLLSSLMCTLFFSIYIAAGLKGFGFLSESLFGIDYSYGVTIALACASFFVLYGGYRALAWLDLFQALFLLVVIFLVAGISYSHVGGWQHIVNAAAHQNISLRFIPLTFKDLVNTLLISVSWGAGYFGTPHIVTKFMGITNVNEIYKARRIGMLWQMSVLFAAGLIGLVGIAYFPDVLINKELVFVEIVKSLFGILSAGFILSAVAGATLSVITGQLLVLVAILTEDLYKKFLRPTATERELLWMYRFCVLLIAVLSFSVSLDRTSTIQQLVQYAWMGFACTFSPLILLSLHSTYIEKCGAITCMTVGAFIGVVWQKYIKDLLLSASGFNVPSVIASLVISVVCAYVVSYKKHQKMSVAKGGGSFF